MHTPMHTPTHVYTHIYTQVICENNMEILKLLSEEVFDFSNGQVPPSTDVQMHMSTHMPAHAFSHCIHACTDDPHVCTHVYTQMTQAKIKELKNSFNNEFSLIYQLCE